MASVNDFPVGSYVDFLAGPTRVPVNAKVTGYDNGFVVTQDATGKERKARPKACTIAA
jgi:hypothetical protein